MIRELFNRFMRISVNKLKGSSMEYVRPMPCPECDENIKIYAQFDPESSSQIGILGARTLDSK